MLCFFNLFSSTRLIFLHHDIFIIFLRTIDRFNILEELEKFYQQTLNPKNWIEELIAVSRAHHQRDPVLHEAKVVYFDYVVSFLSILWQ